MKKIEKALQRVQFHTLDGHSYGLAIHKASAETGTSQREISKALAEKRKEARALRNNYKKALPHWQD